MCYWKDLYVSLFHIRKLVLRDSVFHQGHWVINGKEQEKPSLFPIWLKILFTRLFPNVSFPLKEKCDPDYEEV